MFGLSRISSRWQSLLCFRPLVGLQQSASVNIKTVLDGNNSTGNRFRITSVSGYHVSAVFKQSIETRLDCEGNIYCGEIKDGKFHGKGEMRFKNGKIFEGTWINDKFEGYGTYTFGRGVYVGEVRNSMIEGRGMMTFNDGDVYDGEFSANCFHGKGRYSYADGDVYEGDYVINRRCGQGTNTSASGIVYVGSYSNDIMNGLGRLTFPTGDVLEGNFVDGALHGHGKLFSPEEGEYEGEWKDGQYNGKGTLVTAEGVKYVGDFVEDKQHGVGTITVADDFIYEGEWVTGEMCGYGRMNKVSGDVYEGGFKNNSFEGDGLLTNEEFTYDGGFKAGVFHGTGKLKAKTGESYEGQWSKGKKHGEGEYHGLDGLRYKGGWIDDEMAGVGDLEKPFSDHYCGGFLAGEYHGFGTLTIKGEVDAEIERKTAEMKKNGEVMTKEAEEAMERYRERMAEALLKTRLAPAVKALRRHKLGVAELETPGVYDKLIQLHQGPDPTGSLKAAAEEEERKSSDAQLKRISDGTEEVEELDLTTPIDFTEEDGVNPSLLDELRAITKSPVLSIFEGHFKLGKKHGSGTMYFPNGVSFSGTWKDDLAEGHCVLRKEQTILQEAMFSNGVFIKTVGDANMDDMMEKVNEGLADVQNKPLTELEKVQMASIDRDMAEREQMTHTTAATEKSGGTRVSRFASPSSKATTIEMSEALKNRKPLK